MVRGGEVISDGLHQITEKSEERRENRAGRRASVFDDHPDRLDPEPTAEMFTVWQTDVSHNQKDPIPSRRGLHVLRIDLQRQETRHIISASTKKHTASHAQ